MRRPSNNVFAGKQPMAPAEASHMIQCLEVKNSRIDVLDSIAAHIHLLGFGINVGEEFAVRQRTVGTEFVEDLGKRS